MPHRRRPSPTGAATRLAGNPEDRDAAADEDRVNQGGAPTFDAAAGPWAPGPPARAPQPSAFAPPPPVAAPPPPAVLAPQPVLPPSGPAAGGAVPPTVGPPAAWPAPTPGLPPPVAPRPRSGRRGTYVMVGVVVAVVVALAAGIGVIESGRDRPGADELARGAPNDQLAGTDDRPTTVTTAPVGAAVPPTEERPTDVPPTEERPTDVPPTVDMAPPATTAPPAQAGTVPVTPTGDRVQVWSRDGRISWTMVAEPEDARRTQQVPGAGTVQWDIWVAGDMARTELVGVYELPAATFDLRAGLEGAAAAYNGTVTEVVDLVIDGHPAKAGRFDMVISGLASSGYGALIGLDERIVFVAALGAGGHDDQMASYLLLVDSLVVA